jgi:hypothetical protein
MAEDKVNFRDGGICVVAFTATGYVKEYASHSQVLFIDAKTVPGDKLQELCPSNTKLVVITPGLPSYHYTWLTSFARKKNIPFVTRSSNQAVYDLLKINFNGLEKKATLEEVKETQSKGKLSVIVDLIDFEKGNAENARILMEHCKSKGIATTEASLAQFVANKRREKGIGTRPKSAKTQKDLLLETFDEAVLSLSKITTELQSLREYVIELETKNIGLEIKLASVNKILGNQ